MDEIRKSGSQSKKAKVGRQRQQSQGTYMDSRRRRVPFGEEKEAVRRTGVVLSETGRGAGQELDNARRAGWCDRNAVRERKRA